MSEPVTIKLKSGITLKLDLDRPDLTERFVKHYSQGDRVPWDCPWCNGEIDSVCYETIDDMFEDTYSCEGDCNLLITHITPKSAGEYHNVASSEWTVLIEAAFGDQWYPPEEADHEVQL